MTCLSNACRAINSDLWARYIWISKYTLAARSTEVLYVHNYTYSGDIIRWIRPGRANESLRCGHMITRHIYTHTMLCIAFYRPSQLKLNAQNLEYLRNFLVNTKLGMEKLTKNPLPHYLLHGPLTELAISAYVLSIRGPHIELAVAAVKSPIKLRLYAGSRFYRTIFESS